MVKHSCSHPDYIYALYSELVPVPCKFDLLLLLDFLLLEQLSALSTSGRLSGPDALQLLAQLPVLRPEGLVTLLRLPRLLLHFGNLGIEGFYPPHRSPDVRNVKV